MLRAGRGIHPVPNVCAQRWSLVVSRIDADADGLQTGQNEPDGANAPSSTRDDGVVSSRPFERVDLAGVGVGIGVVSIIDNRNRPSYGDRK
jgi:hypothetical protein